MPVIQWNINFATGIKEIDQHHKHLVDFLNATYEAFQNRVPMDDINYAVEELLEYADEHFACEERWMEEAGYPGLARQKQEHEIFAVRAQELKDKKDTLAAVELIAFLSNWISHHLLSTDAQFGLFLDEQNLRKRRETLSAASKGIQ